MREIRHYDKKKAEDKEYYSISDLVPEITGISNERDEFESTCKVITRIVKVFKDSVGNKERYIKIHKDEKEMHVELLKEIYNSYDYKDIVAKLNNKNKKELTLEEHDKLIEVFLKPMMRGLSEKEQKRMRKFVDEMKHDEFFDRAEEAKKMMINDISILSRMMNYDEKMTYLESYIKMLKDTLQPWREQVQEHILEEKVCQRILEKKPELRNGESIKLEELPKELVAQSIIEVLGIDKAMKKAIEEQKKSQS